MSPEGAESGDVGTVPPTGGASRGYGLMKKTIACFEVAVLLVFVPTVAMGQESEEVLTNADILTLTEAGLPAAVIVAKILATRTAFETTVEQLVALSGAGVDGAVIAAMVETGSRGGPRDAAAPSGGAPAGGGDRVAPALDAGRRAAPGAGVPARAAGTVFRDCDGCPEMVVIPAGSFQMGCVSGSECEDYAQPVHEVTVGSFALSKYEVTFEEYDRFTYPNKVGDMGWGRERRPVIFVSWDDAQEYVAWLSAETGASYRLPSEAEWEYAARAGTTTIYGWGDEFGRNRARCGECGNERDSDGTVPVGSFGANAWGLHDMFGNVEEWVQDCWNRTYRGAPADGSAWERRACGRRVLRGGSWFNGRWVLRAASRSTYPSGNPSAQIGIRVARTLTP